MKYKGYSGSVEYSEEDNCLYGKVMGMSRDCITFEGQDVNELRRDFEGAVDDYLASCAARGVEPAKPYSGTFNVRVPLMYESHPRFIVLLPCLPKRQVCQSMLLFAKSSPKK